jgi:hypothetical protein
MTSVSTHQLNDEIRLGRAASDGALAAIPVADTAVNTAIGWVVGCPVGMWVYHKSGWKFYKCPAPRFSVHLLCECFTI